MNNNYQKRFAKYGVDPKSLSWKSKGAAHQRYRQIWSEIDFNGKSVLDVGCGFGEIATFLDKRYKGFSYTGVDVIPEFISEAKKLHPEHKFFVQDFFKEPLDDKFDVVMASGVLNSNVKDNINYRKRAIKQMFDRTKNVLVFNMMGGHPAPKNKSGNNIWYADSLEVLNYCMSLTRRVILRQHYHPRDFTILMFQVRETATP